MDDMHEFLHHAKDMKQVGIKYDDDVTKLQQKQRQDLCGPCHKLFYRSSLSTAMLAAPGRQSTAFWALLQLLHDQGAKACAPAPLSCFTCDLELELPLMHRLRMHGVCHNKSEGLDEGKQDSCWNV